MTDEAQDTEGRIFVRPKEGLLVRDEARQPYPVEGAWVLPSRHVLRRIREGDLIGGAPDQELGVTPPVPVPSEEPIVDDAGNAPIRERF